MDASSGFISLRSLLSLDLVQVQLFLDEAYSNNIANSIEQYYNTTQSIYIIICTIEGFLSQQSLSLRPQDRSHLAALRTILHSDYQRRLDFSIHYPE